MKLFSTAQPPVLPFQLPTEDAVLKPWWLRCWRWCCQVALVQPSLSNYLEPLIRLVRPNFRAHWSQARLVNCRQQGNFIHLLLKPGMRWRGFVPGQHLQLVLEIDGRAISRTFSISSSLQQYQQRGLISLTIQQQPTGLLTRQLLQLLQDDQPVPIYLSAAGGDFVLQQQQPLLLLAAGSGITPIHAMLSSISRLTQPLHLIYSYRGADQLLFADSWIALQQRFPLLQVQLIDTRTRSRLQVAEVATQLGLLPGAGIYLCGPVSFSQFWQQQLALLGVDQRGIRQESFGLPATAAGTEDSTAGNSDNINTIGTNSTPTFAIVVRSAARTTTVHSAHGSLLQSLEAAGLNPQYGCRRGICMQCLCQKSQGVVRNLLNGATSDAGPGMIQLCISQPLSAVELKIS
jgi:ferredoxin-NADP reductase